VFEAFGGKRSRNASTSSGERREPHDEYFFEKYVINETDGDAGIVDLDDLDELFDDDDDGGAFDIEDLLSDDDDDIVVDLDAAAMALLDGRRLDQLPKGLPAAMVADIQRAIEARGMGRAVFPDDGGDDDDASASEDAEDDPWATEEVRIPVDMAMDGHHAFRVWSDDDGGGGARGGGAGFGPARARGSRGGGAEGGDRSRRAPRRGGRQGSPRAGARERRRRDRAGKTLAPREGRDGDGGGELRRAEKGRGKDAPPWI
jgi:hypothetical protein